MTHNTPEADCFNCTEDSNTCKKCPVNKRGRKSNVKYA